MGGVCIIWSPFEVAQLHRLAAQRFNSFEIASALGGRTPSAVRTRAYMLGIKLANPQYGQVARNPDVATWSAADRISEWARVPQLLAELLVERASQAGLSLKILRSEQRTKELVAFRKLFSVEARAKGYALSQIGRALNRDHSTIGSHLSTRVRKRLCAQPEWYPHQ